MFSIINSIRVRFAPIVNVKIVDETNIGDSMCSPVPFFPWLKDVPIVDIRGRIPEKAHIIFGGGGIFHRNIHRIIGGTLNFRRKVVVWGAGINQHNRTDIVWPKWMGMFDLVGIRHPRNPYGYAPCPSCMHPALDRVAEPTSRYVVYEHKQHPIECVPGAKRMTNLGGADRFEAVVDHLLSGEAVVTNSFHGAYWGLLLGRGVIVHRQFSNRFNALMPLVAPWDGRGEVPDPPRYPHIIQQCRELTIEFSERTKKLLL